MASLSTISGAVHSRETAEVTDSGIRMTEESLAVVSDGESTYLRYFSTSYIKEVVTRQPVHGRSFLQVVILFKDFS